MSMEIANIFICNQVQVTPVLEEAGDKHTCISNYGVYRTLQYYLACHVA